MGHYDVLGVAKAASAKEIRSAYLALARRHHPDAHADSSPAARTQAAERMAEINAAWSVLGTPAQRSAYDRSQRDAQSPSQRSRADFIPYDSGDVPDPYDFDDAVEGSYQPKALLSIVPLLLIIAGLLVVVVGAVFGSGGALALGGICVGVGGVLFLIAPLVAMSASRNNDLRSKR